MVETTITLNNTPVTVSAAGALNGIGGLAIYEFPRQHLRLLGSTGDLTFSIDAGSRANTVANFSGDFGIGIQVPLDTDALGVDANDDIFSTIVAVTAASFEGSVSLDPSTTNFISSNATPPLPAASLCLNAQIDAANITDDASVTINVSGTIRVVWASLGAN